MALFTPPVTASKFVWALYMAIWQLWSSTIDEAAGGTELASAVEKKKSKTKKARKTAVKIKNKEG